MRLFLAIIALAGSFFIAAPTVALQRSEDNRSSSMVAIVISSDHLNDNIRNADYYPANAVLAAVRRLIDDRMSMEAELSGTEFDVFSPFQFENSDFVGPIIFIHVDDSMLPSYEEGQPLYSANCLLTTASAPGWVFEAGNIESALYGVTFFASNNLNCGEFDWIIDDVFLSISVSYRNLVERDFFSDYIE